MITESMFEKLLDKVVKDGKIVCTGDLRRMEFSSYDINTLLDNDFIKRNERGIYTFNENELLAYAKCLFNNKEYNKAFDTAVKYYLANNIDCEVVELLMKIVDKVDFDYEIKMYELKDLYLKNNEEVSLGLLLVLLASHRKDYKKVVEYSLICSNINPSDKKFAFFAYVVGLMDNTLDLSGFGALKNDLLKSKMYDNLLFDKIAKYVLIGKAKSAYQDLEYINNKSNIDYMILFELISNLRKFYYKKNYMIIDYAKVGDFDTLINILESDYDNLSGLLLASYEMIMDIKRFKEENIYPEVLPKSIISTNVIEIINNKDYITLFNVYKSDSGLPRLIKILTEQFLDIILDKEINAWINNDLSNYQSEGFVRTRNKNAKEI